MPTSTKEAEEYETRIADKGIIDVEKISSSAENNLKNSLNKSAIVGFAISLVSMFGIGLAGIIGFILGIVALTQIKYTHQKGRGFAITAIIIGFIWGFAQPVILKLIDMGY
ncbi:MAG: DUF4190 domain-containing protein [Patescibacteria group bacterium]